MTYPRSTTFGRVLGVKSLYNRSISYPDFFQLRTFSKNFRTEPGQELASGDRSDRHKPEYEPLDYRY
jgi:hypothetical protein